MKADRHEAAQRRTRRLASKPLWPAAAIVGILGLSLLQGAADPGGAGSPAGRAAAERSGSIAGTVRLGRNLMEKRMRFSLYPDAGQATPQPANTEAPSELTHVVVFLEDAPELRGVGTPPAGPYRIEQRRQTFTPHVLPVMVGTTVQFPNGDTIYHNVFSLSKSSSFDLGRYPKGTSRDVTLTEPGIIKVFCHIHSDMSAVIMVLPHAFFTSPDAGGRYTIEGIPPGRYRVTGWHERARPIHHEVVVEAGSLAEVNLDIPIVEDAADGR